MKGVLCSHARSLQRLTSQPAVHQSALVPTRQRRRSFGTGTVAMADKIQPSFTSLPDSQGKKHLVSELIAAKEATGKTFTQLGKELGLTNAYTAQLFYNQAQLKESTVDKLRQAVPGLTDEHIGIMKRCPMRSFDPMIKQEPHIYRTTEAVLHYGEAIKAIMNEECGDGIMSAIDMYATIDVIQGKQGEKRLVISLNGKFLPHVEQKVEDNTAKPPK